MFGKMYLCAGYFVLVLRLVILIWVQYQVKLYWSNESCLPGEVECPVEASIIPCS